MTDLKVIRFLLVDDHKLVRRGLRMILELEEDIEIVGDATNGEEAIELALLHDPDVVLMDVDMPVLDGVAATARITRDTGATVLIMTAISHEECVLDCLQAGARGFLLKNTEPDHLIDAIRACSAGMSALAPEVTEPIITRRLGARGGSIEMSPSTQRALADLTDREREVLRLVAAGRSNAEIADDLVVGAATVKTHVSSCLSKLQLRDRVQLVVFAYESGFMSTMEVTARTSTFGSND